MSKACIQHPLTTSSSSCDCTTSSLSLNRAIHIYLALLLTDFDKCNARANDTISGAEALRGIRTSRATSNRRTNCEQEMVRLKRVTEDSG